MGVKNKEYERYEVMNEQLASTKLPVIIVRILIYSIPGLYSKVK
jgi:hypothetical protein